MYEDTGDAGGGLLRIIAQVYFIEDSDDRFFAGAKFFQDLKGGCCLLLGHRMACVDKVQKEVCLDGSSRVLWKVQQAGGAVFV